MGENHFQLCIWDRINNQSYKELKNGSHRESMAQLRNGDMNWKKLFKGRSTNDQKKKKNHKKCSTSPAILRIFVNITIYSPPSTTIKEKITRGKKKMQIETTLKFYLSLVRKAFHEQN
jgi:hypothetical protein